MEAPARRSTLGIVAVFVGLALAAGMWALRFFGEKAPVHAAEWWIGDLALASVFALPALVGVIALSGRSHLWLVAGVVSLVLSVALLVSVATLPLVIPGILYLLAYRKRSHGEARTALIATITLAAALGGLALLIFAPRTVVCWRQIEYADGRKTLARDRVSERLSSSGTFTQRSGPPSAGVVSEESGCTDGVFPPSRSLGALGLTGAALAMTWRVS